MTPERCKELLPIMQAFGEGTHIEYKAKETTLWHECKNPLWLNAYDYRIKPETEGWYWKHVSGSEFQKYRDTDIESMWENNGWVKVYLTWRE